MAATTTQPRKLTPPALAALWGVKVEKILALIHNGSLKAVNSAINPHGRPRFLIDLADIAAFEAARSTRPPAPAPRRKRQTSAVEYF